MYDKGESADIDINLVFQSKNKTRLTYCPRLEQDHTFLSGLLLYQESSVFLFPLVATPGPSEVLLEQSQVA